MEWDDKKTLKKNKITEDLKAMFMLSPVVPKRHV